MLPAMPSSRRYRLVWNEHPWILPPNRGHRLVRRGTGNRIRGVLLGFTAGRCWRRPSAVAYCSVLERSREGRSLWTLVLLSVGLLVGIASGAQLILRILRS